MVWIRKSDRCEARGMGPAGNRILVTCICSRCFHWMLHASLVYRAGERVYAVAHSCAPSGHAICQSLSCHPAFLHPVFGCYTPQIHDVLGENRDACSGQDERPLCAVAHARTRHHHLPVSAVASGSTAAAVFPIRRRTTPLSLQLAKFRTALCHETSPQDFEE